jgi:DNA ligase 1
MQEHSMKPSDVIAQLEATASRLEKEQILREAWAAGCVEFFEGAKLAYHALTVFHINKAPLFEELQDPQGFTATLTWERFRDLLHKLQRREITGNEARDTIRAASDAATAADWNGWYRRILLKDLKCGITESTINKILGEIGGTALHYQIPVFSCQLAKNGEDHPRKMSGYKYLDVKLDGVRILTIIDIENQTVTQYSRDGRRNDRFSNITGDLYKLIPNLRQSIVLDGEMISRSFQDLMKQLNRKEDVDTSDAKLALFDIIPLADFLAGETVLTQVDRHEVLVGMQPMIQAACGDRVYVIPKMMVNLDTPEGQAQFKEFNNDTVAAGYEGIMIKDPLATYRTKRTDAWLKIKPFITVDLEVVGVEPGKPESKFKHTLGGLLCRGTDQGKAIEVMVGGGYTEELRDEIWHSKDTVIGRTVEIKGDALTRAQDGDTWSLRFPVFMGFRDDKQAEVA